MASKITMLHPNRHQYSYDKRRDMVTVVSPDGEEFSELMSRQLAERLKAQGVPEFMWKDSSGALREQAEFCFWCDSPLTGTEDGQCLWCDGELDTPPRRRCPRCDSPLTADEDFLCTLCEEVG